MKAVIQRVSKSSVTIEGKTVASINSGLLILLGVIDEGLQAIIPNRVFDVNDIIFNTLAGTMAIVASMSLRWLRMRFFSPK